MRSHIRTHLWTSLVCHGALVGTNGRNLDSTSILGSEITTDIWSGRMRSMLNPFPATTARSKSISPSNRSLIKRYRARWHLIQWFRKVVDYVSLIADSHDTVISYGKAQEAFRHSLDDARVKEAEQELYEDCYKEDGRVICRGT